MAVSIDVALRGPVVTGTAPAHVDGLVDEVAREIAADAYAGWMTNMNSSFRNPTPYYETRVTTDHPGQGVAVVHDDYSIPYGPWLEGVGSRNSQTRFKGYFSMRRAAEATRAKVQPLGEVVVARNLGRFQ